MPPEVSAGSRSKALGPLTPCPITLRGEEVCILAYPHVLQMLLRRVQPKAESCPVSGSDFLGNVLIFRSFVLHQKGKDCTSSVRRQASGRRQEAGGGMQGR